jgi:hypothetical protein
MRNLQKYSPAGVALLVAGLCITSHCLPVSRLQAASTHPESKVVIVGGGIAGIMQAYYAHRNAQQTGQKLRITIYEKNESIKDTTTFNNFPSLTTDEILSVVPRGKALVESSQILFSQPRGIRVDDVAGIHGSEVTRNFMQQAGIYSQDNAGHQARTQTLLELGRASMDLWEDMYNTADNELKAIFNQSNFNTCHEQTKAERTLRDGYRVDLIYRVPNALAHAQAMKSAYESTGYKNCKILTPDEVITLDPFVANFCAINTVRDANGQLQWRDDSVALWRPGGCIDTQIFLPKFCDYLTKVMGTYTNDAGITKHCFKIKYNRGVYGLQFDSEDENKRITGVRFADGTIKTPNHQYAQCSYMFCPGEAVGTLANMDLKEPAYARFAGPSLVLDIPVPADKIEAYKSFNHCMEVHQEGVVLAWQARFRNGNIVIGAAGTKAFYADQEPNNDQAFAKNRHVLQFNIMNEVLPQFVSLAFGHDTNGQRLTEQDLQYLIDKGYAKRWVGTRAVAYDGFPTLGRVYHADGSPVVNGSVNTHLGSGGASFITGCATVNNAAFQPTDKIDAGLLQRVLTFSQSNRIAGK